MSRSKAGYCGLPSLGEEELLFAWKRSNLYGQDLRTLPAPNWLSDATLNFCFDYYQFEMFAAHSALFTFVPATAAFMVLASADFEDVEDAVNGCDMRVASGSAKRLVFVPINNNSNPSAVGGNHWALLVFDAREQRFFCFDSAGSSNRDAAFAVASKLAPFMMPDHYPLTDAIRKANKNHYKLKAVHFSLADTPQQNNSYDCGVYAVTIAEQLATQTVAAVAREAAAATAAAAASKTDAKAASASAIASTSGSVITAAAEQKALFAALTHDAMNQKRAQIAGFIKAVDAKQRAAAMATATAAAPTASPTASAAAPAASAVSASASASASASSSSSSSVSGEAKVSAADACDNSQCASGATAPLTCTCKRVRYCSKACQVKDWPRHKAGHANANK